MTRFSADSLADATRWLPAARAGNREAQGQALEACRAYLLMVAQRELGSDLQAKGGASDLVQETFLEAQRDFARFQGETEAELLAWLRQMLLHNLRNFARRYRHTDKRDVAREVMLPANGAGDDTAGGIAAGTPTPSAHVIREETRTALESALSRLPADYQEVIRLRYREEQSFEEIAVRMNRTPNAVRKLWSRAVERLQRELEAVP